MSNGLVVYKTGTWDPLHVGHLNVLRVAANLGAVLIVGVGTDNYIRVCKGREPFSPLSDRMRIMSELRMIDRVVPYDGPDDMGPVDLFCPDVVVVDEFFGKGGGILAVRQKKACKLLRKRGVRIVVVPRTPGISSTDIRGVFDA